MAKEYKLPKELLEPLAQATARSEEVTRLLRVYFVDREVDLNPSFPVTLEIRDAVLVQEEPAPTK